MINKKEVEGLLRGIYVSAYCQSRLLFPQTKKKVSKNKFKPILKSKS